MLIVEENQVITNSNWCKMSGFKLMFYMSIYEKLLLLNGGTRQPMGFSLHPLENKPFTLLCSFAKYKMSYHCHTLRWSLNREDYLCVCVCCTHSEGAGHALQGLKDAPGCGAGHPTGLSPSRLGLDLSPHWGLQIRWGHLVSIYINNIPVTCMLWLQCSHRKRLPNFTSYKW